MMMSRGRGGLGLGLAFLSLLAISGADNVNGCSDYPKNYLRSCETNFDQGISESRFEDQPAFKLRFYDHYGNITPNVDLTVDKIDPCKMLNITIDLKSARGRPIVYVDGKPGPFINVDSNHIRSLRLVSTTSAIAFISTNDFLKDICSTHYSHYPNITECPVVAANTSTTAGIPEKNMSDDTTMVILLAITATVAIVALIYAIVIHCKYRKLLQVASLILKPASESVQAKAHGNKNSEVKMSHLSQVAYPQQAASQVTYPQETASQITRPQQPAPWLPSQRPKSFYDSENSLYGAVIL